jgi:putative glutamine amidotransferase
MRPAYGDALVAAGALPVHFVPLPQEGLPQIMDQLDGIVLTGGLDINPAAYGEAPHPTVNLLPRERQDFDFAVAREALRRRLPLLGICLGAQELNVVLGGSLVQDIPSEVEGHVSHRNREPEAIRQGAHPVTLVEGTLLAELYEQQTFNVPSLHHQAVERIGEGLVVAARAPDGVIEAFVHPGHAFLVGVQFHPEIQSEPAGLHAPLFQAFVNASRNYRTQRQGDAQRAATHQH